MNFRKLITIGFYIYGSTVFLQRIIRFLEALSDQFLRFASLSCIVLENVVVFIVDILEILVLAYEG